VITSSADFEVTVTTVRAVGVSCASEGRTAPHITNQTPTIRVNRRLPPIFPQLPIFIIL
jgi:hypothetical protein